MMRVSDASRRYRIQASGNVHTLQFLQVGEQGKHVIWDGGITWNNNLAA